MSDLDIKALGAVSRNPYTGEVFATHPFESPEALEQALSLAAVGFRSWSATSVTERSGVLVRLASILRRDVEKLARMATLEMGKPIVQSRAEIEKCAVMCEWYAEHGPAMLRDQPSSIGPEGYVSLLPLGTILAVMPWNYPYWQIIRGSIPVIFGGNGYMLKHAPNVMGCAYLLRDAMLEAGIHAGAMSVVNITNDLVSTAIADRRVAAVLMTGSVRAGAAIAAQAGAALKKSVLELGGSDAFIVLADADIDAALQAAIVGRFQNAGQLCIAAKRLILEAPIAEEFTRRYVEAVSALRIGNPILEDTFVGPMARYDLRDELDKQVQRSIESGAEVLLGGKAGDGPGNFYLPTVLSRVTPRMSVFDEETFGPVAPITVARDSEHAIELANDSKFGLSGALWTEDRILARALSRRIETGGLFVNGFSASDPRLPIGGVKYSGYGRELSHYGVYEFMNAQSVWFDRR